MRASLLARRSRACYGAAAAMPARSKATNSASLHSAAAPARRVRPARTVSANTCCALGDLAQDRAISGRLLLRYETQPGTEVAPLREACAVADRRQHGARDDRAHPRHRHHPLTSLILFRKRFDPLSPARNRQTLSQGPRRDLQFINYVGRTLITTTRVMAVTIWLNKKKL